jgi:hypothetical protein
MQQRCEQRPADENSDKIQAQCRKQAHGMIKADEKYSPRKLIFKPDRSGFC